MPSLDKLFDDPTIRALLWCLLEDGELDEHNLKKSGLSEAEARAIMHDNTGALRLMRMRHRMAGRFKPASLASLLRSRLAIHLEATEKASELSSLLRSMKQLPDWIFEEWKKAGGADLDKLMSMAGRSSADSAA